MLREYCKTGVHHLIMIMLVMRNSSFNKPLIALPVGSNKSQKIRKMQEGNTKIRYTYYVNFNWLQTDKCN